MHRCLRLIESDPERYEKFENALPDSRIRSERFPRLSEEDALELRNYVGQISTSSTSNRLPTEEL